MDFKTDKEYGFVVDLKDERGLPEGHSLCFDDCCSDVRALQKILDMYIDVSSRESIESANDHKMDFALNFIDSMIVIMRNKNVVALNSLNEVEAELNDVNHRIVKPTLSGRTLSKEEKLEIYDLQEELLIQRRRIKDIFTIQKVFIENMEKTRNFILSMNQRFYSPKSDRFKEDKNFYMDKIAPTKNNTRLQIKGEGDFNDRAV